MIESIINQAQQALGGKLSENFGLNQGQIETTFEAARESTVEGLKSEALSGNISGILALFQGKNEDASENPIAKNISKNFGSRIIEKLGVSEPVSEKIAGTVLPMVLQLIGSTKAAGTQDSNQLLGMLGIDSSGITGALGGLLGGNKDDNPLGKLGKFF